MYISENTWLKKLWSHKIKLPVTWSYQRKDMKSLKGVTALCHVH